MNHATVSTPANINHRICSRSTPRDRRYRTTRAATHAPNAAITKKLIQMRAASNTGANRWDTYGLVAGWSSPFV